MPAKNDAAVVGNIERLVCVERPGVRHFNAVASFALRWQRARPKAECAVDMNPRTRSVRVFANSYDRIHRSIIYTAGLCHDQSRFVHFWNLMSLTSSLIVHFDKLHD